MTSEEKKDGGGFHQLETPNARKGDRTKENTQLNMKESFLSCKRNGKKEGCKERKAARKRKPAREDIEGLAGEETTGEDPRRITFRYFFGCARTDGRKGIRRKKKDWRKPCLGLKKKGRQLFFYAIETLSKHPARREGFRGTDPRKKLGVDSTKHQETKSHPGEHLSQSNSESVKIGGRLGKGIK